jgi:hypothetical protein
MPAWQKITILKRALVPAREEDLLKAKANEKDR